MHVARGGDVIFVSRVLETYGTESVRYAPEAQIRHVEIGRVLDWYRRMGAYGRSYVSYRAWSHTRPLNFRERFQVLRQTIARNRYSWARALSLAGLLAVGMVPFELGQILQSIRTPESRDRP